MKKAIKEIIRNNKFLRRSVLRLQFTKGYRYDKSHYVKNCCSNRETETQLNYFVIKMAHALEKGMSFDKLRPFGKEKVEGICDALSTLRKSADYERNSAVVIAVNTLRKYTALYKENGWTDKAEYKKANKTIEAFENINEVDAGVEFVQLEDIKNSTFDYGKFLRGRHSIREYSTKKLSEKDIKRAIEIARLSPSACNRQMIRVYSADSTSADEGVKKIMRNNLSGFKIDTAHPFVITFDSAAFFGSNERNQGNLNAGLFTMNFVNALHSIGIGSCICEFQQPVEKEIELKNLLNIPESERIAVVVMAGYYLDKNKVYISPRIKVDEIYRER